MNVHGPGARRVAATLYCYAFLDDFVLLYPVYTLLFAETGLSVGQISSLFAVWSLTGIVLEVPSGAWADAVSRRLLLCLGPLLSAAGFAGWVLFPSYWAFALGFVLWGVKGALTSGALEALVFEELERAGAADRYATVMGRATAVGMAAVVLSIVAASPVLAAGGYLAVGMASAAACLLTGVAAATFPETRRGPADADADADEPGYLDTLRAGLAEARGVPAVRRALLVVAVVGAVWGSLEEYTPLLAQATGVADTTVPLLLLVIWIGVTVGGMLAGHGERLTTPRFAWLLAIAGVVLAAGAATEHPAGIVAVAVAFGAFQLADVVTDARLQQRIAGPSRATVTSLAGVATDVTTLAVFGVYAIGADLIGHGLTFAGLSLVYLLVALVLHRTDRERPPVSVSRQCVLDRADAG